MKVMQMLLCDLPHVLSKMGKRKYSVKIHSESLTYSASFDKLYVDSVLDVLSLSAINGGTLTFWLVSKIEFVHCGGYAIIRIFTEPIGDAYKHTYEVMVE